MASTYLQPVSKRRRAAAVALTVLVHLLILLLLLRLAPRDFVPSGDQGSLATFNVGPPAAAEREQRKAAPRPKQAAQARPPAALPPPRPVPQATPVPQAKPDASGVIWLDREAFANSDITGKGKADGDAEGEDTADSAAPYGPGQGPGGQRLYRAEWVREPTSAELRTFLPAAPKDSWGMIACQTIPDNRVDNCRTLGESPLGSRIATGMRRAAWQFLVRPPRVGGKPQIGVWVSIRIDFTGTGAAVRR